MRDLSSVRRNGKAPKREPCRTVLAPMSIESLRDGGKIGCPFKRGSTCIHAKPGACEDCPVFLEKHPRPVLV